MEQTTCGSCAHYLQHYTFDQRKIFRVYCGHCTLTPKTRRPYAKACERYMRKSQEEAFVSKEYLSKELLDYVLKLELLPEIHDMEK